MRFDWYQATIKGDFLRVKDQLIGLGDEVRPAQGLARMYRYEQGLAVWKNGSGPRAHVLWGGQGGTVHAMASGEDTQALEELVRAEYPDHGVTRADAAEDFNEAGAYDRIRGILVPIALGHGVAFPQISDELDEDAGRTQYVGSPRSAVRLRLYEKGKEQMVKAMAPLGGVWPGASSQFKVINTATGECVTADCWTRIEAQVRPPDDKGKRWLASATAEEAWGCSPWLLETAEKVLALQLERFVMTRMRKTHTDRAIEVMCSQYGKAMREKVRQFGGDWQEMGRYLHEVMREIEEKRRMGII